MLNMFYRSLTLLAIAIVPIASYGHAPEIAAKAVEAPWIEAIWRVQRLNLRYQSFTTRYSCEALEQKITDILRAIGAHVSLAIDSGCTGSQLTSSARLSVAIASPTVATPESVAEAVSHDGRDRLVARLRNIRLPQAGDLERFPAQWEDVKLTSVTRRFTSADCDLLTALNEQIFPHLAVRMNRRLFSCPSAASRVHPHIVVSTLRPVSVDAVARVAVDH